MVKQPQLDNSGLDLLPGLQDLEETQFIKNRYTENIDKRRKHQRNGFGTCALILCLVICTILILPRKPYPNFELLDNNETRTVGNWAIASIKANGFFRIGDASKQLQTPNPIYLPDSSHVRSILKYFEDQPSERFVLRLIMNILKGVCTTEPRPLIVDSGANEGIISALAASMGCEVLSVEPQLGCIGLLNTTKARNGFTRQRIVNKLLSEFPISITTDAEVCVGSKSFLLDGTVANTNHGMKAAQTMEKLAKVKATTTSIRLDELINSESQIVALWHIDVEGAEVMVLRSAKTLFENKQIHRVILEVGPERWGNFGLKVKDGLAELRQLFQNWECSTEEFGAYAFEKQLPDIPDVYCVAPWAPLEG